MDGLYIPTVTPKELEGEDKTSMDVQGVSQTGTPELAIEGTNNNGEKVKITPDFDYMSKFVDPTTGNVINDPISTVEGEGIYYLDGLTGKVTFVPDPGFTGTAEGVTVSLTTSVGRDKDGRVSDNALKTATDKYTQTVTTVTSIGKKSATQTGKPIFTEGDIHVSINDAVPVTFEDSTTTKTVSGLGSYTVAADGTVIFIPEAEFTRLVPAVTVVHEDVNRTKSPATYTPTVLPITSFVDKGGREILQLMVNKQKLKFQVIAS